MAFPQTAPYKANIRPGWLGDVPDRNHVLPGGLMLDATTFVNADDTVVTLTAAAAKAAVTLAVEALLAPVPAGTVLNFGTRAAVAVTVNDASVSANATAIGCCALNGPIPSGEVLDFGGKKFARLSAAVAALATSVPVDALATALTQGDVATYEDDQVIEAKVTTDAAVGDETITVAALDGEIADEAEARYTPAGDFNMWTNKGIRRVPAGTPVYASIASIESGAATGVKWKDASRGVSPNTSTDRVYLVLYDVPDVIDNPSCAVVRHGSVIKVNNLPGWDDFSANTKAMIRASYECTVGAPGQEVASV